MKTRSLFIAALVVVSATVAALGKEEPNNKGLAVVPVKGAEVFKVIYKAENAGKIKLNIYNTKSEIVFTETFTGTDGFICPLNFTGLQAGEYTIELIDATGKRTEKVNYKPVSATPKNVHISRLANENGKFLVSVSSTGNEQINVKIYDAANNLVHSENKSIEGNFAQLYTVKNVTGSLTFEVTDKAGNTKTVRF
ncbi:hypothetical protein [Ohtaekwangia koreensis]|uniref:Por secretion system C-terminal sorting domain-containing protein n=1 Tax=Ohtaekwangia koreensis TaxID=688867 RepID=A0A1T5JG06_9BACT|nr:hypothetical protein [Ohtaekwangia koreensis]SKC50098.1 hypothetical protein SAMN05660236_1047 [Ohtaekwangia koreensis]